MPDSELLDTVADLNKYMAQSAEFERVYERELKRAEAAEQRIIELEQRLEDASDVVDYHLGIVSSEDVPLDERISRLANMAIANEKQIAEQRATANARAESAEQHIAALRQERDDTIGALWEYARALKAMVEQHGGKEVPLSANGLAAATLEQFPVKPGFVPPYQEQIRRALAVAQTDKKVEYIARVQATAHAEAAENLLRRVLAYALVGHEADNLRQDIQQALVRSHIVRQATEKETTMDATTHNDRYVVSSNADPPAIPAPLAPPAEMEPEPKTDEEVDAYLRKHGRDPVLVGKWGKAIADNAILRQQWATVKEAMEFYANIRNYTEEGRVIRKAGGGTTTWDMGETARAAFEMMGADTTEFAQTLERATEIPPSTPPDFRAPAPSSAADEDYFLRPSIPVPQQEAWWIDHNSKVLRYGWACRITNGQESLWLEPDDTKRIAATLNDVETYRGLLREVLAGRGIHTSAQGVFVVELDPDLHRRIRAAVEGGRALVQTP